MCWVEPQDYIQQPDDDEEGIITDKSSDAVDAGSEKRNRGRIKHHLEDETLADRKTSADRVTQDREDTDSDGNNSSVADTITDVEPDL
ncbi:hypothetical protein K4K58_007954 [Colletotrichum sp. SAR11_239]|nr:hypothetical protein K4K58_007954 [Colletotrichum sp. SAR11_239]